MNNKEIPKVDNESAFLGKLRDDPKFANFSEASPKAALRELGIDLPKGVELKAVRDTDTVKYLHIPQAPVEGEIADSDLMNVQGGTTPVCITGAIAIYFTAVSAVGTNGTFR
ncbi:hypothetical protein Q5Y75_18145 [Ruegeria sp. 2205SS24-7]|uniref:hypothetical protein n=1 Tax=Ruegeria discodermiae TaxID=3064389 RepID=UPI0027410A10|nr:hypothetical protein [Ruegeria sp. 2205SS24-7]MDP5219145.1 hypothetical protein [Ruegeria sp. 2205SS24-7]